MNYLREFVKTIYLALRTIGLKVFGLLFQRKIALPKVDNIKRILVIRMDGIGDMVLSLPALKALRESYPKAHISILIRDYTQDIVKESPFVDEILIYKKGINLKSYAFDLVFDFIVHYQLSTAILAKQTQAKYRIGVDLYGRGVFFNIPVVLDDLNKHIVEQTLDIVRASGVKAEAQDPQLVISDDVELPVEEDNSFLVCIHPGGIFKTKRWLPERFAEIADWLIQEHKAQVILMSSESERFIVDEVRLAMKENCLTFIGRPLKEGMALIKKSRLFIGNNSGLLHIAAAFHIPTVSTMGPAVAGRWWPYGKNHIVLRKDIPCIGCGKGYCRIKTIDCMNLISTDEVIEAINRQIQK